MGIKEWHFAKFWGDRSGLERWCKAILEGEGKTWGKSKRFDDLY